MKKTKALFYFIFIGFLAACSDNTTPEEPYLGGYRIKTITVTDGSGAVEKVIDHVYVEEKIHHKTEYDGSGNPVLTSVYHYNPLTGNEDSWFLKIGQVDYFQGDQTSGTPFAKTVYQYDFFTGLKQEQYIVTDDSGQSTRKLYTESGEVQMDFFTGNAGSQTTLARQSILSRNPSGEVLTIRDLGALPENPYITYTYDEMISPFYSAFGFKFLRFPPEIRETAHHNITSIHYTDPAFASENVNVTYTYNEQNRPLTANYAYQSGGAKKLTFTYLDN